MNEVQETLRYELGYKVRDYDPTSFLMNIDVAIDGGNITKIKDINKLCPEGYFSREETLSNFKSLCEGGYIDKQDYLNIESEVDTISHIQKPTMIVDIKK